MQKFKYDIHDILTSTSGKTGKVIGRSHSAVGQNTYCLEIRNSDTNEYITSNWYDENELKRAVSIEPSQQVNCVFKKERAKICV